MFIYTTNILYCQHIEHVKGTSTHVAYLCVLLIASSARFTSSTCSTLDAKVLTDNKIFR